MMSCTLSVLVVLHSRFGWYIEMVSALLMAVDGVTCLGGCWLHPRFWALLAVMLLLVTCGSVMIDLVCSLGVLEELPTCS